MSDRIHHVEESPDQAETPTSTSNLLGKPKPLPGTYVIQIPKDQVYRVPPPENAYRYKSYTRRTTRRRRSCCCCFTWIAGILLLLLLAVAATAGILYLIFRPKLPNYSVDRLSVKGFNLNSNLSLSPEFDVTVRAENPNKKIGIYYLDGSSVTVSYSDVTLCNGVWPTFYQGTRNVTVFQTALTGTGIRLSDAMHTALQAEQGRGEVPLELDIKVPVKVKFGAVKSWTITVKVRCDVKVDKLTVESRIVSKTCRVKVDI